MTIAKPLPESRVFRRSLRASRLGRGLALLAGFGLLVAGVGSAVISMAAY